LERRERCVPGGWSTEESRTGGIPSLERKGAHKSRIFFIERGAERAIAGGRERSQRESGEKGAQPLEGEVGQEAYSTTVFINKRKTRR